jgi:hypothetical protein
MILNFSDKNGSLQALKRHAAKCAEITTKEELEKSNIVVPPQNNTPTKPKRKLP